MFDPHALLRKEARETFGDHIEVSCFRGDFRIGNLDSVDYLSLLRLANKLNTGEMKVKPVDGKLVLTGRF